MSYISNAAFATTEVWKRSLEALLGLRMLEDSVLAGKVHVGEAGKSETLVSEAPSSPKP